MRFFPILATICTATVGTAASALVEAGDRTWVDVTANGYDTRTFENGCTPKGCGPYNTRDNDISPNSRWSCLGDNLDSADEDDGCCITYSFEVAQDLVSMSIAFHKGDESDDGSETRSGDTNNFVFLVVFLNGGAETTITSSGNTLDYQYFDLNTDETKTLTLCFNDPRWYRDTWLSLTEVKFWVE